MSEIDKKYKKDKESLWWTEPVTEDLLIQSRIKGNITHIKSDFQDIKIIKTIPFGKLLVIDGHTQSSQFDEHLYHESLVHPAMLLHKNPKRILIGGGGELATAREVLKHITVEKVVMIEIDSKVIELAKHKLSKKWDTKWVLDDKRFELVIQDAKKYIEEYDEELFDVIILDIVDPLAAGPGVELYTNEFYATVKSKLKTNGFFVTQAGPCGLLTHKEGFTIIHNTLKKTFDHVLPYTLHIPCFLDLWGIILCWRDEKENLTIEEVSSLDPKIIDNKIKERINNNNNSQTRQEIGPLDLDKAPLDFPKENTEPTLSTGLIQSQNKSLRSFDGITYRGQVNVPKFLRDSLKTETRVIDKEFIKHS